MPTICAESNLGNDSQSICTELSSNKIKYKTLFISDTHLGSVGSQDQKLLQFLKEHEFEKIYLVGDFIDIWMLNKRIFWPQSHTDVIRKLLKISKRIPIFFITGNHDEFCENFLGVFGNITICKETNHIINDKNFLIIHGHQFDYITKHSKIIAYLGSIAYNWLLSLNSIVNKIQHLCGIRSKWSLSSFVKKNVKNAVSYIFNFEKTLAIYAKNLNYDGVICGHIHSPAVKRIENINYYNTGDWVESCTALVETYNGELQLIDYLNK